MCVWHVFLINWWWWWWYGDASVNPYLSQPAVCTITTKAEEQNIVRSRSVKSEAELAVDVLTDTKHRAASLRQQSYLSLRRTVAELRGVKFAQFSDFGLFSPYKTHKTYFPVTSLQPRGYIAEWFRFFPVIVEGSWGRLPAAEFFCDFWQGSCGPPNLLKFLPMANGFIHTECNCTARQILTKDVWKRAILKTDVLSHQISSPLPPKSSQNPILGDL